jgi:hypothetical protein
MVVLRVDRVYVRTILVRVIRRVSSLKVVWSTRGVVLVLHPVVGYWVWIGRLLMLVGGAVVIVRPNPGHLVSCFDF